MKDFKPYGAYGVETLLAVLSIKERILKIEYWEDIDELIDVVSACNDFEMAWKMQNEPLVYDEAMRRMDRSYSILDSKYLFKIDDILWRIKRL